MVSFTSVIFFSINNSKNETLMFFSFSNKYRSSIAWITRDNSTPIYVIVCEHSISETMQISTILDSLTSDYEHVVVVITISIQLFDLVGVSSVLLDVEVRQQDTMLQISSNSLAFNVHNENLANTRTGPEVQISHPSLNVSIVEVSQTSQSPRPPPLRITFIILLIILLLIIVTNPRTTILQTLMDEDVVVATCSILTRSNSVANL